MRHDESDPASNANETSGLREARESVMLTTEVRRSGNLPTTKHLLRDLSPGGARLSNAESFRSGETIFVTVGDLNEVAATIVWVSDKTAGLKFSKPIDTVFARSQAIVKNVVLKKGVSSPAASPDRDAELDDWFAGLSGDQKRRIFGAVVGNKI